MRKKDEQIYKWVGFAQDYLSIAELACQEMIEKKYKCDRFETGNFSDRYPIHNLYIPMMFNLKHGIELVLKLMRIILENKIEKGNRGHDIEHLFALFRETFDPLVIIDTLNEVDSSVLGLGDKENMDIAKKNTPNLPSNMDKIKAIVTQYGPVEIIPSKNCSDPKLTFSDVDNTFFRYSENSSGLNFDYDKYVEQIDELKVGKILTDIKKLFNILSEVGFLLTIYDQHASKTPKIA